MVVAPLDRSAVVFGLWSFGSHFLTSFQGFFIALLYCFLNDEVSLIFEEHVKPLTVHYHTTAPKKTVNLARYGMLNRMRAIALILCVLRAKKRIKFAWAKVGSSISSFICLSAGVVDWQSYFL